VIDASLTTGPTAAGTPDRQRTRLTAANPREHGLLAGSDRDPATPSP